MNWTQASARVFRQLIASGALLERSPLAGVTEVLCRECSGFVLRRASTDGRLGTQRDRQCAEVHAYRWHHSAWLQASRAADAARPQW